MHRVRVSMLGTFTVHVDDVPLTHFGYDKVRALLAYLTAEDDHVHRREALSALLWPDTPEHSARQNLSQAISTLRKLLGERGATPPQGWIIDATRQTVRINPDADLWTDIQVFGDHLRAVREHAHAQVTDCEHCLAHLEQAMVLYRGDFLEDLALSDSVPFEEWALLLRERLRRQALEALDVLTEARLGRVDTTSAACTARRQLAMDPWRESAHRQLMRALALDGQRNAALGQYEACREILARDLDVVPEPATTALYAAIRDAALGADLSALITDDLPPAPGLCPYKGLPYFDVDDAGLFFGREDLTERLVGRVADGAPFLAVIGASGSGKSSLLRAGLVARLRHTAMAGSKPLRIKVLTPTADPLHSLCRAVVEDGAATATMQPCRDALLTDSRALSLRLSSSAGELPPSREPSETSLLVVDQFEELFSLCRDPVARHAFIDNLVTAALEQPAPGSEPLVHVVIALRADFYHHCADYEALRGLLEAHQLYIGAMNSEELRRAMLGPANRYNWTFEPGLVELLLRDIGAGTHRSPEPGALPLLSHALLETWKRRQGRTLTLKGYADAGGVRGAIAQSADVVYGALSAAEQQVARSIFFRLTEVGDDSEDMASALYTRRRASLQEILPAAANEAATRTVLNTLARARLITMERDAVEVAHEALIREWPTLRGWLEADLNGLRLHRHLTVATQAWVAGGRDPADLYRGARLGQAEEWTQAADPALNPLEREFLAASLAEAQRLEIAREAQRRRELETAQQLAEVQQRRAEERGRLLRWLALAAGLLLVAAITAALLGRGFRTASLESAVLADANATAAAENAAVAATAQAAQAEAITAREQEAQQRTAAEGARQQEAAQRADAEAARTEAEAARTAALTQAAVAQSNLLAVQSSQNLEEQVDLALLLGAEAYAVLDSRQSRSTMLTALEAYPGLTGLLHAPQGFLPLEVAFSPDGRRLAAASRDALVFWDLSTGRLTGEPWQKAAAHGDMEVFRTLAYNPAGTTLATGGCAEFDAEDTCLRGEITLWDADTGQNLNRLRGHTYTVRGVAYDPVGRRLASCGDDTVLIWNVADVAQASVERTLEGHTTPVAAVAFSPDGALLASVGVDFEAEAARAPEGQDFVRLWEVETGALARQLPYVGYGFANLAFSADGTLLAAGSCNRWTEEGCDQGLIRRWSVSDGQEVLPPAILHSSVVGSVHFIDDDAVMLSIPWDTSIALWDLVANAPMVEQLRGVAPTGLSNVSPDGQTLATVRSSTIYLWDTAVLTNPARTQLASVSASYAPIGLTALDISPDGALLAAASTAGQIHLQQTVENEPAGDPLVGHMGPVVGVAFSPDGATLASGGMDATVRLWNVDSGLPIRSPLQGHAATVTGVAFSPDGSLLASCSDDTTVRLWDAATGEPLSTLQAMSMAPIPKVGAFDMNLWDVAFSPDGTKLAVAVAIPEKVAALWDVSDPTAPQAIVRLPTHADGGVTQVAFSPDGHLLAASVGRTGRVLLWKMETYEPAVAPIAAHESGSAWPLAFSPDGRVLASGSLYSTLRLIDVATGSPIGPPLKLHTRPEFATPTGLAFGLDGRVLFSSSADGALRRWDVDPDSWREKACALAGRNFTQAEWAQYLPEMPYRATCPQWPVGE